MLKMAKMNKNISEVPFSLEKIIKGMPEQAYVFSEEGKLLTWNENVEILSGYSADELKNKFVTEFIYQPDKERVVGKFMELLAEGDDRERVIEYRLQIKSGKVIPVIAIRSLLLVDGKEYVAGILIDIRKSIYNRKKLETRVAEMIQIRAKLQDHYYKIEQLNQTKIELQAKLFINTKEFNDVLINNLPGIFYLCEKVGDKFYIKRWNNNFETKLGYSKGELLNMQPHQTFADQKEYKKVEKAIQQIFITGSAQVTAMFNTKDGRPIPYFFDGYLLEDMGKTYFMGVGMDLSNQYALEKKYIQQERDKQKAKKILDENKRELVATALHISKTAKIIKYTLKQIDELLSKNSNTTFYDDLNEVKRNLRAQNLEQDNWETFRLRFTGVHNDFFDQLKAKYPMLTKSELKFCAYLRIHLSSSQISSVLNVTNEAIKKNRYRIRKKMNLSPKDSLEDYVSKF